MAEATRSSPQENGLRPFLTFRLDQRLYALAAEDVVEVIRPPPVARVPLAPKALIGVINLRGVVLPLTSLRGLLGLDESGRGASRAIVLDGAAPAALAVDSIEALVTVASDRVETRQAELAAMPGERLTGAFQVEGLGAAKILDVKALLDEAFAQRAEGKRRATAGARRNIEKEEAAGEMQTDVLVTFEVANQEYALALSAVQEIVPAPDAVAPMPLAETLVVGMMAFRDQLLPLLSLRGLLGFPPAATPDAREKVVVTSVGGAVVGLVVDRARAIVWAERGLIDPIPAMLAARSGGEARIRAIYRGESGRRLISVLAPEQLFREDVMQRLGTRRAAESQRTEVVGAERQFLVFQLGDGSFGLPIEAVSEVARVPDQITRLPKAPKFLEGVVNLRGEVLPVVDQRRRFDMPKLERTEGRRLVVVRAERHRAGLIVDSVSEVLRSASEAIAQPPDLTGDISRLVRGVINLEDRGRIVLLLDPGELLTRAERGLLDAFERKAKT
jgi:purine-binding chemotaxis protein CheW